MKKQTKTNFARNLVDCSKIQDENPTVLLERESDRLKVIPTLSELKEEMTKIIDSSSIGRRNKIRFERNRDGIETVEEMRVYLYNFILAGSALQTRFGR